jgi:hypothetical protein
MTSGTTCPASGTYTISVSGSGTDQDGLFAQQNDPITLGGTPGAFTFGTDCRVLVGAEFCKLAFLAPSSPDQYHVVGLR